MREYRYIAIALLFLAAGVVAIETVSTAAGRMSPLDQAMAFVFSPFQRAVAAVGRFSAYVFNYGEIEKEQNDLRNENYLMKQQLARLELARAENLELRRALHLKNSIDRDVVAVQVVGRDPSEWFDTLTINGGTEDGIRPDQGVVGGGNVAGKIWEVSGGTARVALVTNPQVAIPVEILPDGGQGIAYGREEAGVVVKYLPLDVVVKPGDVVVTSGLGHIFRTRGIPLGVVTQVMPDPKTAFFKKANVKPFVGSLSLHAVLVIR